MVRLPEGRYLTWGQWRLRRRAPVALAPSCPLCWGAGRIWEPFLGAALLPIVCEGCRGTGRA
jgi:hypothetical protein